MMPDYLTSLAIKMMTAGAELDADFRARHAAYVLKSQLPDGGFSGRMRGAGDAYYTSFALRTLMTLGVEDEACGRRLTAWLRGMTPRAETLAPVDFLTFLGTAKTVEMLSGEKILPEEEACAEMVRRYLEPLRRECGMFAKSPRSAAGSVYQTFLVLTTLEFMGEPFRSLFSSEGLTESLTQKYRLPDGGFREHPEVRTAGVNPTAAAVGILRIVGELTDEIAAGCVRFFHENALPDGGWRANPLIPVSDLLSTFTAMVTLENFSRLEDFNLPQIRKFVKTLELPDGGFRAAAMDTQADVEYTFYGVGAECFLRNVDAV